MATEKWKDGKTMETKVFPFELTKADTEGRTIEGYAAAFGNVDSVGDIIHKGAFAQTIVNRGRQIKLLWQHNTDEPIGKILEMREDDRGLFFRAAISDTQRGRDALALVKDGALDSMSIGYDAVDKDISHQDGAAIRNLRGIRLWEISMVTFPANEAALITGVKQEADLAPTEGKPYRAVNEGDVWRVYKLDAEGNPIGDALGEHPTEDEANAQIAALYANEPEAAAEGKAGRVLATRNADKIRAALDALTQVLIDAGIDLGTDEAPQEETTPAQGEESSSNAQHDSKGAGPATPPTHDRTRLLRLVEFEIESQKNMGG